MLLLISALMVPFLVVVANPFFLWLQVRLPRPQMNTPADTSAATAFSMVTVVRTPDFRLLEAKIDNVQQVEGLEQWILYHDGPASTELREYLASHHNNMQLLEASTRKGKNSVLNDAVEQCTGDIIISVMPTACNNLIAFPGSETTFLIQRWEACVARELLVRRAGTTPVRNCI